MSFRTILFTGALVSTALAFSACEWSGGSDGGFNTSKVDFNANISGQYFGLLAGGKAVANTSGAAITRLLIQQTGNALEVTDTFGNKYRGQVGAPGAIGDFGAVIPQGASVASFQVGWRGTDNTAGREVEFSGVVNLITVENVQGDTTTSTSSSNNSSESVSSRENGSTRNNTANSTSSSSQSSESGESTDSSGSGAGGDPGGTQTITIVEPTGNGTTNTTTIVTTTPGDNLTVNTSASSSSSTSADSGSDRSSSSDSSSSANNSSSQSSQSASDTTRTTTSTFNISEANSQFRLQGTWIEQGGLVSPVEARSAATAAILTTTTTTNN